MNGVDQSFWLGSASTTLGIILLSVSWIDQRKMIIPDSLNAALALAGVVVSLFLLHNTWFNILLQCGSVYMLFWVFAKLYSQLRKRNGLGGGDIKFLAAATSWVGIVGLPWTLLIASLSGLTFVLFSHLMGHHAQAGQRIAFGPHLSVGLFLTWMFSDAIFTFAM